MSAPLMMVLATLLFAAMGVCVKFASQHYATGEIVFYRGLIGAVSMVVLMRSRAMAWQTALPVMHLWRATVGVTALGLWFYSIGGLPLATAMTLNYMSSVWMAVFLMGGAIVMGRSSIDGRLIATVLVGFVGVALILRPTIERDQLWHGLLGLLSGILSAMAYLQVTALGRAGEPEPRVVFYFSIGGMVAGLGATLLGGPGGIGSLGSPSGGGPGGFTMQHTFAGAAALIGVGVFATAAQLLMTRAYAIGRPLVNASLQYLGIAYAFGFGVLLFDDPVTPMALAGTVLVIAAGLAATQLRNRVVPKEAAPTTIQTMET